MEIIPGVGVALVKVGESRAEVEARLGTSSSPPGTRTFYEDGLTFTVTYTPDDIVEHIDVGHMWDRVDEATFDGVQLTYRFMDDVLADLSAKGHASRPFGIGHVFEGFAIWSMHSLSAAELDPEAGDEDERMIVEGVGVAPFGYWD